MTPADSAWVDIGDGVLVNCVANAARGYLWWSKGIKPKRHPELHRFVVPESGTRQMPRGKYAERSNFKPKQQRKCKPQPTLGPYSATEHPNTHHTEI
jgi:hypothetical protein